ncbi:hypothetical protein OPS25_07155 [Alteromonas ponticola]|uniref:Uncharacterized protein n=1 Tax=Alteromonas aquimaris TaxID=2998417 RepID=A0ABT3P674_9ALTE|nr:hypothetical protein [Alteromonas aquimaris]MCW8108269.1 hypothetical protein [Alteromonas aquimaris]
MNSAVNLREFDKTQLKQAKVLSGISPAILRRVFIGWLLFCFVVAAIVAAAPDLSDSFVLMTLTILVVFTIVMFAQNRLDEGWPAIIYLDEEIGVVCDPQARKYICVPLHLIEGVKATTIKPNKKAVAILLKENRLSHADKDILNEAVWPREDKLLATVYYTSSARLCRKIRKYIEMPNELKRATL